MSMPAEPLGGVARFGAGRHVDDDLDAIDAEHPATPLEHLRGELADETDDEVTLEVPRRAGWSVRYGTDFSYEQLTAWQKGARDRTSASGLNDLRYACIVLANTCRGILRRGEDLTDGGEPLVFRNKVLWGLVTPVADRTVDAVQRFYGRDAHVIAAAKRVLIEAGYADIVETADDDDNLDPS